MTNNNPKERKIVPFEQFKKAYEKTPEEEKGQNPELKKNRKEGTNKPAGYKVLSRVKGGKHVSEGLLSDVNSLDQYFMHKSKNEKLANEFTDAAEEVLSDCDADNWKDAIKNDEDAVQDLVFQWKDRAEKDGMVAESEVVETRTVQEVYDSLKELRQYAKSSTVLEDTGFASAAAMWVANPAMALMKDGTVQIVEKYDMKTDETDDMPTAHAKAVIVEALEKHREDHGDNMSYDIDLSKAFTKILKENGIFPDKGPDKSDEEAEEQSVGGQEFADMSAPMIKNSLVEILESMLTQAKKLKGGIKG